MKSIVIALLIAVSIIGTTSNGYSQKDKNDSLFKDVIMPIDEGTKLILYKNVVNIDAKKDSLYKKSMKWFKSYYKNPNGILKTQNSEEGKIVAKPQFKINNPPDKKGVSSFYGIVYYTITILTKDGKCKYEITDINLQSTSKFPVEKWLDKSSKTYTPSYNYFLKQVDEHMKTTIQSYEKAMKSSTEVKKDEW